MKLVRMLLVFTLLVVVTSCSQREQVSELEPQVFTTYQVSNALFPNPERGFFIQRVGWDRVFHPDWESLPLEEMQQARRSGYSLVRVYYLIPEFKGKSLSSEFLAAFRQHFSDARKAGVKLIPLFAYSWPSSDDYSDHPERFENQDAPVSDIKRHLGQLKPIIQENVDVMAMWDAGFIGPWGEWHTSTNELIGDVTGSEVNSKTREIVTTLLETVPVNRMITVRTPRYKQQLTGQAALTKSQAFNSLSKARIGAKNDCFLASKTDWGTYLPDDDASIQAYKDFLHQDNLFLPQQGETCNFGADAQPYIDCPNALAELAYLRYSALNINYQQDVLQGWREGGCFNEISRRFGYRFQLVSSGLPTSVSKSSNLVMSFDVKNVGFASPYNPRRLELILRNQSTKQVFKIILNSGALTPSNQINDPRFWQPNTTTKISIDRPLPSNLPVGTYDVLLNLPDPSLNLRTRAAYAIRFANVGTWESATGYNSLLRSIKVNP
jgi:hypothetical protein